MNVITLHARSPSDADTGTSRLSSILWRVTAAQKEIEQIFLDMGEHLLGSTSLLNEIVTAHEGIPGELDSVEFGEASGLLNSISDQVQEMEELHTREENYAGQLFRQGKQIEAPLSVLHDAVKNIRIIAINARIVAAGIKGHQTDLAAFTQDMTILGQEVDQAVSGFTKTYNDFCFTLEMALGSYGALSERHGNTISSISRQLAGHRQIVDNQRLRAIKLTKKHDLLIGQIRTRLVTAVGAQQFGDITRQRLEHAELALRHVATLFADTTAALTSAQSHTVSGICLLQEAQLMAAKEDFEQKLHELQLSLRQLSTDAANVFEGEALFAEEQFSAQSDALNALIDDLCDIRTLLVDFGGMRTTFENRGMQLAEAVAAMIEHSDAIGGIQRKIRFLGLNTAVHCSRLGDDGHAFNVIAQGLRDLARRTASATETIVTILHQAEDLARQLRQSEEQGVSGRRSILKDDTEKTITLFNTVINRLHNHSDTITSTGPKAVSKLNMTANFVAAQSHIATGWCDMAEEIASLALVDQGSLDLHLMDQEQLVSLRRSYTMESERKTYDGLFGKQPETEDVASGPVSGEDIDDLLF